MSNHLPSETEAIASSTIDTTSSDALSASRARLQQTLQKVKWHTLATARSVKSVAEFSQAYTPGGYGNATDANTKEIILALLNEYKLHMALVTEARLNYYGSSSTYTTDPSFYLRLSERQYRYDNAKLPHRLPFAVSQISLEQSTHRYSDAWVVRMHADIAGVLLPFELTLQEARTLLGLKFDGASYSALGEKYELKAVERLFLYGNVREEMSLAVLASACRHIGFTAGEMKSLLKVFLAEQAHRLRPVAYNQSGITKVVNKLTPFLDTLKADHPLDYLIFNSLVLDSSSTVDGVKLSTVFNQTFENVASVEDILAVTRRFYESDDKQLQVQTYYYSGDKGGTKSFYQTLPVYLEARKQALKAKGKTAMKKLMQDVEFLNLDAEKHPLFSAAVLEGKIPIGTFFRKSEQYHLYNDNFDLWEAMMERYPEETVELAQEASKRTYYEKDLMSYFWFLLYELPEYLEKHTGRKWRAIPKLVDSPNELEPPKEDGNRGVSKQRSALTPHVDNATNTVVVPYASLAMPGRQTAYCYSHDYHVLRRGFSFNGNVVVDEVEEKLNGRDDYGLMFYTLTGTDIARGYPTFLIIFERRETGTHVHFHRVHPSRSKSGDYNPIHNWIKTCYNWMIGNVPREDIIAQQGDLAFVRTDKQGLEFGERVMAYDNHKFDDPVSFDPWAPSDQKNVLGHLKLDADTWLTHHEHEPVLVPAGTYQVRQCRSWEANPKGVWSLRID